MAINLNKVLLIGTVSALKQIPGKGDIPSLQFYLRVPTPRISEKGYEYFDYQWTKVIVSDVVLANKCIEKLENGALIYMAGYFYSRKKRIPGYKHTINVFAGVVATFIEIIFYPRRNQEHGDPGVEDLSRYSW